MFWLGKSISTSPSKDKKKDSINLSPLEVLILAQLRSRELRNKGDPVGQYGYEMIQQLNTLFAGSWEAKSGTIYPILSKLEGKKNMIKGSRKKSPLGPVKKVYILEDLGRKSIDFIVRDNFKGDIDFIMQYINLLAPFVINVPDELLSEELFDKMMSIPSKSAQIALEKAITEVDVDLRNHKIRSLHTSLKNVLKEIEKEL
ncbi:hypothetical protein NEF87_000760 [Candidatus Lokiarchaeum ossiferum]|uniref:Transcription regulator PadR N-terminal domain-containing protein n=1 Tax=Candidatus Lokiarchaeum ossiferum TaxID=2951803 RepID=A0ABY6HLT2_9ARCH|nr:hypothetical protein NEF87_000760 [Candidatus Lokiarchaeum sp. B-35]